MWRMPYVITRNLFVLPGILKKMQRMVEPGVYNEEKCYIECITYILTCVLYLMKK